MSAFERNTICPGLAIAAHEPVSWRDFAVAIDAGAYLESRKGAIAEFVKTERETLGAFGVQFVNSIRKYDQVIGNFLQSNSQLLALEMFARGEALTPALEPSAAIVQKLGSVLERNLPRGLRGTDQAVSKDYEIQVRTTLVKMLSPFNKRVEADAQTLNGATAQLISNLEQAQALHLIDSVEASALVKAFRMVPGSANDLIEQLPDFYKLAQANHEAAVHCSDLILERSRRIPRKRLRDLAVVLQGVQDSALAEARGKIHAHNEKFFETLGGKVLKYCLTIDSTAPELLEMHRSMEVELLGDFPSAHILAELERLGDENHFPSFRESESSLEAPLKRAREKLEKLFEIRDPLIARLNERSGLAEVVIRSLVKSLGADDVAALVNDIEGASIQPEVLSVILSHHGQILAMKSSARQKYLETVRQYVQATSAIEGHPNFDPVINPECISSEANVAKAITAVQSLLNSPEGKRQLDLARYRRSIQTLCGQVPDGRIHKESLSAVLTYGFFSATSVVERNSLEQIMKNVRLHQRSRAPTDTWFRRCTNHLLAHGVLTKGKGDTLKLEVRSKAAALSSPYRELVLTLRDYLECIGGQFQPVREPAPTVTKVSAAPAPAPEKPKPVSVRKAAPPAEEESLKEYSENLQALATEMLEQLEAFLSPEDPIRVAIASIQEWAPFEGPERPSRHVQYPQQIQDFLRAKLESVLRSARACGGLGDDGTPTTGTYGDREILDSYRSKLRHALTEYRRATIDPQVGRLIRQIRTCNSSLSKLQRTIGSAPADLNGCAEAVSRVNEHVSQLSRLLQGMVVRGNLQMDQIPRLCEACHPADEPALMVQLRESLSDLNSVLERMA